MSTSNVRKKDYSHLGYLSSDLIILIAHYYLEYLDELHYFLRLNKQFHQIYANNSHLLDYADDCMFRIVISSRKNGLKYYHQDIFSSYSCNTIAKAQIAGKTLLSRAKKLIIFFETLEEREEQEMIFNTLLQSIADTNAFNLESLIIFQWRLANFPSLDNFPNLKRCYSGGTFQGCLFQTLFQNHNNDVNRYQNLEVIFCISSGREDWPIILKSLQKLPKLTGLTFKVPDDLSFDQLKMIPENIRNQITESRIFSFHDSASINCLSLFPNIRILEPISSNQPPENKDFLLELVKLVPQLKELTLPYRSLYATCFNDIIQYKQLETLKLVQIERLVGILYEDNVFNFLREMKQLKSLSVGSFVKYHKLISAFIDAMNHSNVEHFEVDNLLDFTTLDQLKSLLIGTKSLRSIAFFRPFTGLHSELKVRNSYNFGRIRCMNQILHMKFWKNNLETAKFNYLQYITDQGNSLQITGPKKIIKEENNSKNCAIS